jgi:TRAP-type C4-dicarboxylate transport system substrate-binding protein
MKRYQSIGLSCIFIIVFFLLTAPFPAHSQETIKLKCANFFPPVHKCSILAEEWCKEIEKRTSGRVKITYLPGGTLVPANQSYEGAVRGIADISLSSQQWMAGRFPLTEALYLPLGVKSGYQGTIMINEWYKKFKPKEYDDVKVLYLNCAPPGVFMTLKPLPSINDLKGLKIRAAGDTAKIVTAMGAIAVSVPMGDIYEGLQRGVVEGVIFPAEALKGWRFGDLIRGLQDNDGLGYPSAQCLVMNKGKWNSLPADIQNTIEKINEEYIEKQGKLWDETTKEGVEFGVSKGMKVFKISPAEIADTKEKMKPVLADYVKRMKDMGLPGEESLKFLQDFVKSHSS